MEAWPRFRCIIMTMEIPAIRKIQRTALWRMRRWRHLRRFRMWQVLIRIWTWMWLCVRVSTREMCSCMGSPWEQWRISSWGKEVCRLPKRRIWRWWSETWSRRISAMLRREKAIGTPERCRISILSISRCSRSLTRMPTISLRVIPAVMTAARRWRLRRNICWKPPVWSQADRMSGVIIATASTLIWISSRHS